MPKGNKGSYATYITKKFSDYLKSEEHKPGTKGELRTLYYDSFKPTLTAGTPGVSFSTVMNRLKWRRILGTAEDRTTIVYYQSKKLVSVDQRYVQRQQSRTSATVDQERVASSKEKNKKEESNWGSEQIKEEFLKNCEVLVEDKNGIRICSCLDEPRGVIDFGKMTPAAGRPQTVDITISNTQDCPVTLQTLVLDQRDSELHLSEVDKLVTIPGKKEHRIQASFEPTSLGQFKQVIVFTFSISSPEPSSIFHIVRFLTGCGTSNDVESILPTEKYHRPAPFTMVVDPDVEVVPGTPLPLSDSKLGKAVPLEKYLIPFELRKSLNIGKPSQNLLSLLEAPLTKDNHGRKFSTLLHIEEMQMEIDIRNYDMAGAQLTPQGGYLVLKVPGLAENRPSVIKGDRLYVRLRNKDGEPEKKEYEGFVHQLGLDEVKLRFSSRFHNQVYIKGMPVDVRFTFSRTPLKLMHRALEFGCEILDPNELAAPRRGAQHPRSDSLRFFDEKLQENPEQRQAVENIVAGTSQPVPYLVFGPPGTGKTVTIAEAIKQVLSRSPRSRVLACAPSNSAADLILERVTKHTVVHKEQIIRLNALGRSVSTVPKEIKQYCCISSSDDFFMPSSVEILRKRLVVCTLITAGRLVSAGLPETHFTHVFIDEAGQSLEPEILVPLSGLVSACPQGGTQVVLAGDPQQLGPVLRSPLAIKHGLGMSLLERLMTKVPSYGRLPAHGDAAGKYDTSLLTKLLKNYRSHPAILKLPNEMFYDNELLVHANQLNRESLCGWEGLPRSGFPVMFRGLRGRDLREQRSPSFFNPEEAAVVTNYVQVLKDARGINVRMEDIGVISPYRKQVHKISQLLQRAKITGVKVGSVELFQGQERRVIIISTVRSSDAFLDHDAKFKLGFLKNPKRFNVALTRAQALLIVVGNPHVLCVDEHWRGFIKYCKENGGYTGCAFDPDEQDEELVRKFAQVNLGTKEDFQNLAPLEAACSAEDKEWSRLDHQ